ncbi:hypothetical protein M3193_05040 [Sporosarcina luteola]|uniref:hypothetical protein n=1 Tax=Sporosarcina luteola TaxID=582850 RepID=UPI00203F91AA|nr:hypothetical protein [Sporosarcina luteola]MCM3743498.1 hypothetical protein [Sporosarcina luteola]
MKKLQWNMEEVFYFPENVGVPKEARLVKVKAGFTEKRSEDAVRLSGIYHIAAKVDFTEGQRSESIPTDAIFVDDVELEGETGYFEYAVPLYIDLPPEVDHPLHIEATDVKSKFDGQGSFTVTWNVNCTYGQETAKEVASNETAGNGTAKQSVEKEPAKQESVSKEPVSQNTVDTEAKKQTETAEEKSETAAVQDAPKEKTVAAVKEQAQAAQATETRQSSGSQNRIVAAPVHEPQAAATHDSSIWSVQDDILSYIATLPDEWTTTRFRSNDIFVKEES